MDRLPSCADLDSLLVANADLEIFSFLLSLCTDCFSSSICSILLSLLCTDRLPSSACFPGFHRRLGDLHCSESDHPDFLKSFVIGSALFNILVGLKPRSFSSRFPIVGEIQEEIVRRRKEHTQATPDQPIDEKQLYYDAVGECSKGRIYGLGSLAKMKRRYDDLSASTSREPMVRRSELDAVVQRLAQFEAFLQSQLGMRMDFGASTIQAHHCHHRRHHFRSIISRWGWIRLVQHSSSTTMMMRTSMIG
ncbi:hypothetical protein Scep_017035 [Stephania cephalantha]|uniref:Uncharacterized protein n=1 Tax=Stephania cephalantha TaxID=152367 RepID=A0AAP0NT76_9MAGN